MKSIGYWAFSQCPNLTSVVLPASVRSINDGAFWRCKALSEVRFQGEAPNFTDGAFSGVNATAYYPVSDLTWTTDVLQNYGGTITWVPYSQGGLSLLSSPQMAKLSWVIVTAWKSRQ